jgi:indolepyruvate ferredoxin oxidoreductase alpha subunit
MPAARRYIVEHGLNELLRATRRHEDRHHRAGRPVQHAGRALQQFGLADAFGDADIPTLVLNVTYPLVPDQMADFCAGKRAVLVVEEGQPEYIEQEIATLLRRRDLQTPLHGKDLLPGRRVHRGGDRRRPGRLPEPAMPPDTASGRGLAGRQPRPRRAARSRWTAPLPPRPPSFCIGCPERPVFSALKLAQQTVGPGAHGGRHRLPCLRHLRAVFLRPPSWATA